jgi:hypothetical protein
VRLIIEARASPRADVADISKKRSTQQNPGKEAPLHYCGLHPLAIPPCPPAGKLIHNPERKQGCFMCSLACAKTPPALSSCSCWGSSLSWGSSWSRGQGCGRSSYCLTCCCCLSCAPEEWRGTAMARSPGRTQCLQKQGRKAQQTTSVSISSYHIQAHCCLSGCSHLQMH